MRIEEMTSAQPVSGTRRGFQVLHFLRLVLSYALLLFGSILMLVPFAWMLSTSLKPPGVVFDYPPQWIPNPVEWSNYQDAWTSLPFGRFTFNSFFVSISVTALQLLTSSLAAYAFARLRFPGRDTLFVAYLATLMVPGQVTLIPNFILMRYLGWIDTYQVLIIPQIFSAFGTFLLRQFFLSLPSEIEDAARIDGASSLDIYARIIIPLSGPALATLGVFTFMGQWNSFLWPFVMTDRPEMKTVTVGLRMFQGQFTTQWNLLMAGTVMSIIPILIVFLFAQRYFVRGIALTGIAGR